MKIGNISVYGPQLSQILETTDKTGGKMGELFEPLKKAVEKQDYSDVDLQKTKTVFQNGTDVYKKELQNLNNLAIPVRVIGKHKSLTAAYSRYVDACQAMVNTIDAQQNKVDVDQFKASEHDQSVAITKVMEWVRKIMAF